MNFSSIFRRTHSHISLTIYSSLLFTSNKDDFVELSYRDKDDKKALRGFCFGVEDEILLSGLTFSQKFREILDVVIVDV